MFHRRRLVCVLLLTCIVILASSGDLTAQTPRDKLLQKVETQVVPAYQLGDTMGALGLLSELTKGLDADGMGQIDGVLRSAGLPAAGELILSARLWMIQQGQTKQLPPATRRETLLMIPVLRDEANSVLHAARSHASMGNPLPCPNELEEFERLFWDIHVLENRLRRARDFSG